MTEGLQTSSQRPQFETGFQHLKCKTKKKGPQSFNICKCDTIVYFSGDLGGHFQPGLWQPKHNLFLNLTKWFLYLNLISS